MYAEDTLYICGMEVARKEFIEYKLNTSYSFKKLYECIGFPVQYEDDLMSSLIHYVKGYFTAYEYSLSNIEKFQTMVLHNLTSVLVSPYVIREMCKLYRII